MELLKSSLKPERCRKKFLKFFPNGFYDETYLSWERDFKMDAHERWKELLEKKRFSGLLAEEDYKEIIKRVLSIESRTILLFSFEKMALRDALRLPEDQKAFAQGLYQYLHGHGTLKSKFENYIEIISHLPKIKTRVLTWPVATVFGFIAQPKKHCYLKPNVTKLAAKAYGYDFKYHSKPNWETYKDYLDLCEKVKSDLKDLKPRDMFDIQSFLWVQGSDEY